MSILVYTMTLRCNFCGGPVEITEATEASEDPHFELYQCRDCLSEGYLKKTGGEVDWYGCIAKEELRKHSKRPSPIEFDYDDEDTEKESYDVEAGSDNRTWTVIPLEVEQRTAEFEVHYPDEDKTQDVEIDRYGLNHDCSGTYFEYHESCPHVKACKKVLDEHY